MIQLKICGMKYPDNLSAVAALKPDYLGFIFYEKSPRYMADTLSPQVVRALPKSIQRVGVFVNASTDYMMLMAERYGLHALQLHGEESPQQCRVLKEKGYTIIKVFSAGNEQFDFTSLQPYQPYVDFFLFDTQGVQPGGNGQTFDWSVLKNYPLVTPFFLSGGIGPNAVTAIQQLTWPKLYALDVNSRFETEPGRKDTRKLTMFIQQMAARSDV